MPGISVENGTLKAHGEKVLKIQVDSLRKFNVTGSYFFNITNNVTPQYVVDSNSITLHRYFMLMFTFNLNTMIVPANSPKSKESKAKKKKTVF